METPPATNKEEAVPATSTPTHAPQTPSQGVSTGAKALFGAEDPNAPMTIEMKVQKYLDTLQFSEPGSLHSIFLKFSSSLLIIIIKNIHQKKQVIKTFVRPSSSLGLNFKMMVSLLKNSS